MDAAASGTTLLPEIRPSVINATSATALSLSNAVTMLAMPPAPNTQYHSLYATWLQACYMAHFRAGAYCVVTRRVCLSLTEHVCTVYNQLSVFTGYSAHEVKEVLGISACVLPRCKSTEVTCWEVCSRTPDSSRVNSWQQVSATSGLPFRLCCMMGTSS